MIEIQGLTTGQQRSLAICTMAGWGNDDGSASGNFDVDFLLDFIRWNIITEPCEYSHATTFED
jgi:hypothetical protein